MVTLPVLPEIVTLDPATIEVTMPVRSTPLPTKDVAVTTPTLIPISEVFPIPKVSFKP